MIKRNVSAFVKGPTERAGGARSATSSAADTSARFRLLFLQRPRAVMCVCSQPLISLSQLDVLFLFLSGLGGGHSWPDMQAGHRLRERRAAGGE